MKNISEITAKNPIINKNNNDINEHITYRQPMYLARSSSILYEILNKTLNYSFKKKMKNDLSIYWFTTTFMA
ncbi:unnamed protein product, partial [Rotaria socialis]